MDYGHEQTKIKLEQLEKELGKLYGKAAKELTEKFRKHVEAIAPKRRVKQSELRQGKISQEDYNKWIMGQIAIGKRWHEMKQTLSQDFSNVHDIAAQMIGDSNMEVYALNHNYGTYEAEHGSGVNTSYTLYDKHTVERLVKENPDILPTPTVGDDRWDKRKFQEGITQGILQGESIPKVAKRVVLGTMEKDMKKAVRNARTATTSAQNGGRLNSYKRAADMGIKLKKTWMATDDSFTRQSHIDVDGETIPVNETFSNECEYPGDPGGPPEEVWNCRCTMIADVEKASPSDKLPEGSFFDKPLTKERYDEWVREHKQTEVKDNKSVNIPESVREEIQEYVDGTGENFTAYASEETISFVKENMEKSNSKYYRVENARHTANRYEVGQEFSFTDDIRSFADNKDSMYSILNEMEEMNPNKEYAIIETRGSAYHFPVDKYINENQYDYQKESLLSGKFEVVDKYRDDEDTLHVIIKQIHK